jgi:hypothetical protein
MLTRHLHHIIRVGTVAEDRRRDPERAVPVTGEEPAERLGIATLGLPQKCRFIVLDAPVLVDRLGGQRASR